MSGGWLPQNTKENSKSVETESGTGPLPDDATGTGVALSLFLACRLFASFVLLRRGLASNTSVDNGKYDDHEA